MSSVTEIDRQTLSDVCAKHGVKWLAVFGSVARGQAQPDSDADVLVEFEPGVSVSYFGLEDLADALSPLFGGRYVDIGRPSQLHWMIRDSVLKDAQVLYAR